MTMTRTRTQARVVAVASRACRLELPDGSRVDAVIRGKLFEAEGSGVVVGDRVGATQHAGQWAVDLIEPRSNEFVRRGLRKERQVLFANVDRVLILASLSHPRTKTASTDRFLAAAMRGGVPALLVLTKIDLDGDSRREGELRELYGTFDLSLFAVCNLTGEGVGEVASAVSRGDSALVGHSGVGKSSLLNRLIPHLNLRVREVSAGSGKGTHTTTAAVMIPYGEQAALIDTPGMKSFIPYGITRENLGTLFPDIAALKSGCRFRNCLHGGEPDCAVAAAARDGKLPASRLRSYHRLLEGAGREP